MDVRLLAKQMINKARVGNDIIVSGYGNQVQIAGRDIIKKAKSEDTNKLFNYLSKSL